MGIALLWVAFCILTGIFASQQRNRNGFGYFILAMLISPLLAFLLVACLKELPEEESTTSTTSSGTPTGKLEDMIPAVEFAKSRGICTDKAIQMVRDGFYVGRLVDGEWYVDPNS